MMKKIRFPTLTSLVGFSFFDEDDEIEILDLDRTRNETADEMWNRGRGEAPDFRFPEVPKPRVDPPEQPVQRSQGVPHILKKPRSVVPTKNLGSAKTKGTSGLLQGQPLLPSYRKRSKAKKSFSATIPYPPKWLKNVSDLPGASSCIQPSQSVVKELNWQSGTPQEGHQGPFQPHRNSNEQIQPSESMPKSKMSYQQTSIGSIQPRSSAPTHQDHQIGILSPPRPIKTTQSKVRAKPRTLPRSDPAIAQFTEVQPAATIVQKAMNVYNPSDLAQCQQKMLHGYETSQSLGQSMGNLNLAPNQHPGVYWGPSHQSEGPRFQNLDQQIYSNPGPSNSPYFPVVSTYHQDPYYQQHLQNLPRSSDGSYQGLYNPVQYPDPYHHSATGSFSSSSDEFQDYGIEGPTTLIHGSRKRVFSRGTSSTSQPPPKKPKRDRRKIKVQESSVELQPMKFGDGKDSESMKRWLEDNVKPAVLEAEIRKRDLANKVARIDSKKITKL